MRLVPGLCRREAGAVAAALEDCALLAPRGGRSGSHAASRPADRRRNRSPLLNTLFRWSMCGSVLLCLPRIAVGRL